MLCYRQYGQEGKNMEKVNKFGVSVGDIFKASWGYDQTNINFFQVIALVGKCSVRVREVYPELISEQAYGAMSRTCVFKLTHEMLPPVDRSLFIVDQEKGDIKRLKSWDKDGVSNPLFDLKSYAHARLCTGDTVECYESWYA